MSARIARWRSNAVHWVADHPMSIPGRIAARRFGRPPDDVPVVEPGDSSIRVLVAPANYAGQARAWCSALEARDANVTARNYAVDAGGFGFAADAVVPLATFHNSREWQRAQFDSARGFTHLLEESFIPPFGRLYGRDLERQLDALGDDVSVAFMCHGSDVRRPSLNRERTSMSPFVDGHAARRAEELAIRHLDVLARSDRPVFVSTPDLLDDVPRARWCPVVVEPARWWVERRSGGGTPRVVHVPSKAAAKGSAHIEPVLERLASMGVIEYRPLRGIPHAAMPAVLASADVVVDQLSVGSYGVAACEALAAGCVVVGHVTERVRSTVADRTGLPLPIVEADAESLEDVVAGLAAASDEHDVLADAGRRFVDAVHDGARSARELLDGWVTPA